MVDNRAILARSYISESVKNSSAAIKACWTIVFTAGTVGSLSTVNEVMRCRHIFIGSYSSEAGRPLNCHYDEWTLCYLVAFVVYFLTFVRFYLGGVRVFDIKYSEMFSVTISEIANLKSNDALARFSTILAYNDRPLYKFEVLYLLSQSLVVVALAYNIDVPINFINYYFILLFCNSVWLVLSAVLPQATITNLEGDVFPEWRATKGNQVRNLPRDAAIKWACNNVIHCIILAMFMMVGRNQAIFEFMGGVFEENALSLALVLICLSNCIFDFILAHNFYFPKFLVKYRAICPVDDNAPTPLPAEAA